ncbi:hypothetical protein WwAna1365 [Wolbachia endosymbiont of Drosophila ananassae]|nr:hypothetical protein WwAna1365 [Wolbachia endosymbiont of Drosophila ananassae]
MEGLADQSQPAHSFHLALTAKRFQGVGNNLI